jgi:hypothetical protein
MTITIINIHNPDLFKVINSKFFTNKQIVDIITAYSNSRDFPVDLIGDGYD